MTWRLGVLGVLGGAVQGAVRGADLTVRGGQTKQDVSCWGQHPRPWTFLKSAEQGRGWWEGKATLPFACRVTFEDAPLGGWVGVGDLGLRGSEIPSRNAECGFPT